MALVDHGRVTRLAKGRVPAGSLAGVSTEVIERPDTRPSDPDLEDGKVAHIIRKDDQMRGYVLGEEITALCGEKFIPTRDPNRYPVCEACRQVLAAAYGAG